LAGDHASSAGRFEKNPKRGELPWRFDVRERKNGIPAQEREGIARENRRSLAVDLMIRRSSAAKIIVIHRGKVVVDERVGVGHFDGGAEPERDLAIESNRRRNR